MTRVMLLEALNSISQVHAGRKVGFIQGYHDQWMIGASIEIDKPDRQVIRLHFCQGRNVGRINFNGGYSVSMDVSKCLSVGDVMKEFVLLDHHKRREKEKCEERCQNCIHYLRRLTGGCEPGESCGYERIRKKKNVRLKQSN